MFPWGEGGSEAGGMKPPGTGNRPARAGLALAFAIAIVGAPPAGAQTAQPDAAAGGQPALATESSVRLLEARIEELDRRLGASALLDLVARVGRLEKEIKELRDRTEIDARSLEALQGRQQDLYAELDRLAQRLAQPAQEVVVARPEGAGAPDSPAEPAAGPSTAAAGSAGSPGPREPGEAGESDPAAPERASPGTAESGGEASAERGSPPKYDPVEEQAGYQLAFDLLSEGRFERAANSFTEFLAAFPESRYRDTARFWKGECLYALRRFEPALKEFRMLVEDHPESSRIPGARLKIGFILHEIGRSGEAAEELRALIESDPDTSEAKLARDRLERLE